MTYGSGSVKTSCGVIALASLLIPCAAPARAQHTLSTADAFPTRYVAAHGTRALLSGNASAGLEGWAYPVQIFRGLEPSFRRSGAATALPGKALLRRIDYAPTYVERTYESDEFTVRERLFVPRDLPGAILSYTVASRQPVSVELSFVPVLDLMWPVGVGGQEIHWEEGEKAYRMEEPTHRFSALLGSDEAIAHDDLPNTHAPVESDPRLHLQLRSGKEVRVVMAADARGMEATRALYAELRSGGERLMQDAERTERERIAGAVQVETPDAAVNEGLAWSEVALDQAWVCNPALGCGLVAGYGPSRGVARRPQYAWFFAGDALVSLRALLLTGDFARAREVLTFLMRYQDKATGMMWHELSQSASYVNWAGEYPYMFPHVDTSFLFLSGMAAYAQVTGDSAFLEEHWTSIEGAYRYCRSLTDATDGLPRVPAGKEGHDEQGHPREELALAVDWVESARAYASMAAMTAHTGLQGEATHASDRASAAIPRHFWNTETHFWNAGVDASGGATGEMHVPAAESLRLLDATQRGQVLDRIAGPEFETAWGTRGVGSGSRNYDPTSYATGSVWATSTVEAAQDLWEGARPGEAWGVWRKLLAWLSLDSMGHVHETLSGVAFEPQVESVPEQTWSSAMLLSSFLEGVAGLKPDAAQHRITISPQMPEGWTHMAVERVRAGGAVVGFTMARSADMLALDVHGSGDPVEVNFVPRLPDGARISTVLVDGMRGCGRMRDGSGGCSVRLMPESDRHRIVIRLRGGGR